MEAERNSLLHVVERMKREMDELDSSGSKKRSYYETKIEKLEV